MHDYRSFHDNYNTIQPLSECSSLLFEFCYQVQFFCSIEHHRVIQYKAPELHGKYRVTQYIQNYIMQTELHSTQLHSTKLQNHTVERYRLQNYTIQSTEHSLAGYTTEHSLTGKQLQSTVLQVCSYRATELQVSSYRATQLQVYSQRYTSTGLQIQVYCYTVTQLKVYSHRVEQSKADTELNMFQLQYRFQPQYMFQLQYRFGLQYRFQLQYDLQLQIHRFTVRELWLTATEQYFCKITEQSYRLQNLSGKYTSVHAIVGQF